MATMDSSTPSALTGHCGSSFWSVVDPTCWWEDPMGVLPSLQINGATCTSGTAEQQVACKAGVLAAQAKANSDSDYAGATSGNPIGAAISSLTLADIPNWLLFTGAGLILFLAIKQR